MMLAEREAKRAETSALAAAVIVAAGGAAVSFEKMAVNGEGVGDGGGDVVME